MVDGETTATGQAGGTTTGDDGAQPDGTTTGASGSDPGATSEDVGTPGDWMDLELRLNLLVRVDEPTALTFRAGEDDLWVTERRGRVRLVARELDAGTGVERLRLVDEPALDITGQVTTEGEGGLLGMAFSPDGSHLYLQYTDRNGDNVVSEFGVGEGSGDQIPEIGPERVLLQVAQPYANHNGGDLAFGPDGLLYISLGDGGSGGDPEGNGQNRSTLLGSVLRIDPRPTDGAPYGIPADNPFADSGDGFRPEIWVWGVRNPWRISFDAATGDLWIADVGQREVEEVNFLPATGDPATTGGRGANLGWNLMEGTQSFAGEAPPDHVPPVHSYRHENSRCSITGGYVYRGELIPELKGLYVYSDYCSGEITGLERAGEDVLVANLFLDRQGSKVIAFGRGPGGELYVLEQEGRVNRIESTDWPYELVAE
jgi:glucose/arabinose dehydrogenase